MTVRWLQKILLLSSLLYHTGRVHLTGYRVFDDDDEEMMDPMTMGESDSDLSEDLSEESDEGRIHVIIIHYCYSLLLLLLQL